MSKYSKHYPGPENEPCPYCGAESECDACDVGVGFVQCGPYICGNCGASEIGPEKYKPGCTATTEELKTGWYKHDISPYANTVGGVLVDHKTAKMMYDIGLLDEKPFGDEVQR